MIIAIDIGNTTTTVGIYKADKFAGFYRIAQTSGETGISATSDDIGLKIYQLVRIHHNAETPVDGIAICSVVPDLTQKYIEMAKKYFKIDAWVLDYKSDIGLKIDVDQPEQVGSDRLANAIAVKALYGCPSIVIDFGTATTFDVINRDGNYIGGAIAPGVSTSSTELFRKASQLYPIQLKKPEKCIGTNSTEAMRAGIFYGTLGQIDYIAEKTIAELDEGDVKVIATGGFAEIFAPYSTRIQKVDQTLTLQGIILAYRRNR